jgi:hypothetical protein
MRRWGSHLVYFAGHFILFGVAPFDAWILVGSG